MLFNLVFLQFVSKRVEGIANPHNIMFVPKARKSTVDRNPYER